MSELLYGQGDAQALLDTATTVALTRTEEVELSAVQVYYCLFETPMATALTRLPPSLHPSVPAHLGFSFWRCAESPFGAFELAFLGIACRSGIKPRHLIYRAFTDNPAARVFFRERYGFDCRLASVRQRETYDRVIGTIRVDERTLLEVVTTGMQPLAGGGATVKYAPALNPAQLAGRPALIQCETSFAFKRVLRGTPQVQGYDGAGLGDPGITPTFAMSGTHAIVDIALHPARFQIDAVVPAERGGARKITRAAG